MRTRGIRALVGAVLVGAVLVLVAEPAAACSCGAGPAPTIDFTGVAVEDLGYSEGGGNVGLGETHAWRLEVTNARQGVEEGEVRISMVVGEVREADGSFMAGGCGLDDNLILGETYDVTSGGLEDMILCGSQVDGPRGEVPERGAERRAEADDERLQDLLVIFGGGVVLLLLTGLLVVRPWRDRETFHKPE